MIRIEMPHFRDAPLSEDAEWLSQATLGRLVNKLRRLRVNVTATELPQGPTEPAMC